MTVTLYVDLLSFKSEFICVGWVEEDTKSEENGDEYGKKTNNQFFDHF